MTTQSFIGTGLTSRRTYLRLLGIGAVASVGAVGGAGAHEDDEDESVVLRREGEVVVANSHETWFDDDFAYVATGSGFAVVDLDDEDDPVVVVERDLADDLDVESPAVDIKDVKADGDLLVLSNDAGEENPSGIALYDVSDPANPVFRAVYEPDPPGDVHNAFVEDDLVYVVLSEPWELGMEDGRDLVRLFGDAKVEIVDASDPSAPTKAGEWQLKQHLPAFAKSAVAPLHDVYVQDDVLYAAWWDAGVILLDVSDPTDPQFLAQFGEAPDGDVETPPLDRADPAAINEFFTSVFPFERYLGGPGNAHYVQPSPDGTHVFVGAETFEEDLGPDFEGVPGPIDVWDVRDLANPTLVATIDAPDVPAELLHTSHNFDLEGDLLAASWYFGGVRLYDVSDPANPVELAAFDPEGYSFWTAVFADDDDLVLGGVYGEESTATEGGVVVLEVDDEEEDENEMEEDENEMENEDDSASLAGGSALEVRPRV